jgi:hypothetical protein
MLEINWNRFELKNKDYRESFQELSYHLFCRKFNQPEGVKAYNNQVGIETEPIYFGGVWIRFQSKFFDYQISSQKI